MDACRKALFISDPIVDRETLKTVKGHRTAGTCEWIRDNAAYKALLAGDTQRLWISGGPGQGKTMLSMFLTEELEGKTRENRNAALLFYFCTHQNEKRATADTILRSLVYQLLTKDRCLYPHVSSYFEDEKRTNATLSSAEALWLVLTTLLQAPEAGQVFCVLDGLDECDVVSQSFIASKFNDLWPRGDTESPKSKFTLIVVSRPIAGLDTFTRVKLDPDNDSYVDRDIRQFISFSVGSLQTPGLDEDLREKVKETLLRGACGTFLWVGFVMRELSTKTTCTELMETLETLPPGLPGMYSRMLRQTDPNQRPVIFDILKWVTLAFQPLTLGDLATAVGIQATGTLDLNQTVIDHIAMCGPILRVTRDGITLVHQSAKDYLLRTEPDDDPTLELFRIEVQKAHAFLAARCLDCIETSPFRDGEWRIEHRRVWERWHLVPYAIKHWTAHAAGAGANLNWSAELKRPFFDRLSRTRTNWYDCLEGRTGIHERPPPALLVACEAGILELARQLLLEEHVGFQRRTPKKRTERLNALRHTIFNDRPAIAQLLLEHGVDISAKYNKGRGGLLKTAITFRNLTISLLLLDNGAKINEKDSDGNTALWKAVGNNDTAAVRLLLDRGADIDIRNKHLATPLANATTSGDGERVTRLLLDRGAEIDAKNTYGSTPIRSAIIHGETATVRLFLQRGAVLDMEHALHWSLWWLGLDVERAVMRGVDVMKLLIEYGADLHGKLRGWTPIHTAMECGRIEAVKLLLDNGARVDAKADNGATPLSDAVSNTYGEEFIRLLIDHGADVNAKCNDGEENVLSGAVMNDDLEAATLLLVHGADVNAKGANGLTAISHAIWRGNKAMIQLLIDHGADTGQEGGPVAHALWMAERGGDVAVLRLLLEEGRGSTPSTDREALRCAIRHQNIAAVEELLKQGADAKVFAKEPWIIIWAARKGNAELVRLSIKNGANVMSKLHEQTPVRAGRIGFHYHLRELLDDDRPAAFKMSFTFPWKTPRGTMWSDDP